MNHYCWESALDGRRVVLHEDVVADLRMVAIEGFTALRRRGLEVGGIVFGDVEGEELRIEGFLEAPCEHRYGPSYSLSDNDREKLTELLTMPRHGQPPVVGFYRSFTSREPVIEAGDEALVAEHFPQGYCVLLMLHPLSAEKCVATYRLFSDGKMLPAPEEPPFPFEPNRTPAMETVLQEPPPDPRPDPPPAPVLVAEPAAVPISPPMWAVEPAPRSRSPWLAVALIGLAGTFGGVFLYELGLSHSQNRPTPWRFAELYLDARPESGTLQVTWDAAAARSLDATRGALTIADGDTRREVELGPAQVQAGRYTYAPEHADVAVRLTLAASGHSVASEAVRLATPSQATPPQATPPQAPPPTPVPAATDSQPALPPSTVHEVYPKIPAGIRSRIEGQIVIPVQVQVSNSGRVLSARVQDQGTDGIHRYLAEQAGKAARAWQFTPARTRSGTPIAAAKTIQFVFTP
jgi:TonB family protein